jgi:CheY-like chemotaxis protein
VSRCEALVLLVEDDSDLREIMAEIVDREGGHTVVTAGDGLEAIDLALSLPEPPGLIILDLMMPVLSGWGFLELAREEDRLAAIPIITVSASPQREMALPVAACLRKPIRFDELLREIARGCRSCGRMWPGRTTRKTASLNAEG